MKDKKEIKVSIKDRADWHELHQWIKVGRIGAYTMDIANRLIKKYRIADLYKTRAFLYEQMGEYRKSVDDLKEALVIDPKDKQVKRKLKEAEIFVKKHFKKIVKVGVK